MIKAGRRRGRMAALSIRRAGITLGLAGFLIGGAAVVPSSVGVAAFADVHRTGWRIVPSPNGSAAADNTLMQVSAGPAASGWAVGYDGYSGRFRTQIQRWNGAKWTVVASPSPSKLDNVLSGVATLSATSAWAVGYDAHLVRPWVFHRAARYGTTSPTSPTPRPGLSTARPIPPAPASSGTPTTPAGTGPSPSYDSSPRSRPLGDPRGGGERRPGAPGSIYSPSAPPSSPAWPPDDATTRWLCSAGWRVSPRV